MKDEKRMTAWKPSPRNAEILERAMDHLKSVPYSVSLRWLFYRLYQDGIYRKAWIDNRGIKHDDYKAKWTKICSAARINFWNGWRPDIIEDDTRWPIRRVGEFKDKKEMKEGLIDHVVERVDLTFDHFWDQDEYVVILFEARAMIKQFQEYTRGINLYPFGGDPSVPFKWDIFRHLEWRYQHYEKKPLRVLYFGDHDDKGNKIYKSAKEIIGKWCRARQIRVEFTHCGLNAEQVEQFGLPDDPEHPGKGKYQWEALTDPQAREIIEGALDQYNIDVDLIRAREEEGQRVTAEWREKIRGAMVPLVARWNV